MIATAIKTRPLEPPYDDLLEVLDASLGKLHEGSIVVVSSKVVAIWQGRCEKIPTEHADVYKEMLVKREADKYLEKDAMYRFSRLFTIFEGLFGSSAGIDESNGHGWYVLLPKGSDTAADAIRTHLKTRDGLNNLGVVIVDSRSVPMRNGVTGVALGHAGFNALYDYRGKEDIFGRTLKFERTNVADCLASSATLMMGEGDECTPLVVFEDVPRVVFTDAQETDFMLTKSVDMHDDVFAQFFEKQDWQQGKHTQEIV